MDTDNKREPPPGVIVASNGAWRDAETGRFVPGGPPVKTAITTENYADYHRLRKQRYVEGMLLADGRLRQVSADYWGDIAEAMYKAGKGKGVAAVQAAKLVGEMTGYLAGRSAASDDSVPAGGMRLELGGDAVAALVAVLASRGDAGE